MLDRFFFIVRASALFWFFIESTRWNRAPTSARPFCTLFVWVSSVAVNAPSWLVSPFATALESWVSVVNTSLPGEPNTASPLTLT